eukprot:TRINITY_DN24369_c0_g2_i1.p1 TRINITY_DN24369_c0_g2~~TRINITY_DN24369_c0_g2_i1.p1  ORF type:complete len:873 (-),score=130.84 TRINITY_DN24369_c0_g2_i1:287-2905(-)
MPSPEGEWEQSNKWQYVKLAKPQLLVDRSSAELWYEDFFHWTVGLILYWGCIYGSNVVDAIVYHYTLEVDIRLTSAPVVRFGVGFVICWCGLLLLGFARVGASALALERGAVGLIMAVVLIYTLAPTLAPGDTGFRCTRSSTTIFDQATLMASMPLFRKTWCPVMLIWAYCCHAVSQHLHAPGKESAPQVIWLLSALAKMSAHLLVWYFVLSKVEDFQSMRKGMRDQLAMNDALLNGLCDGNVQLTPDAKTVVRSDEKFRFLVGAAPNDTAWVSHFYDALEYERFVSALANQAPSLPSLVNVSLRTAAGAKVEAELFIASSCHGSVADRMVAVGVRLPRDNCRQAPPAGVLQPTTLGAASLVSDNVQDGTDLERVSAPGTVATVEVFNAKKPGTLDRIIEQGKKEHWYLKPSRISFDLDRGGQRCQIGKGGYGAVYRGQVDGAAAALKVSQDGTATVDHISANELRTIRRLRHPNIVLFLGCTFSEDKTMILAFEYVDGETLHSFVSKQRLTAAETGRLEPISTEEVNILLDICAALSYMHAQEPAVYHSDIKPLNIMVFKQSGKHRAKLLDFGLSKIVASASDSNVQGGTVRWSAPETVVETTITANSDVYSFGCVAICLLSTQSPFEQISDQQYIKEHLEKPLCPPFDWDFVGAIVTRSRGVPAPAIEVLRKCTCWHAVKRPALADVEKQLSRCLLPETAPFSASARSFRRQTTSLSVTYGQRREALSDSFPFARELSTAVATQLQRRNSTDLVAWLTVDLEALETNVEEMSFGLTEAAGGKFQAVTAIVSATSLLQAIGRVLRDAGESGQASWRLKDVAIELAASGGFSCRLWADRLTLVSRFEHPRHELVLFEIDFLRQDRQAVLLEL